MTATIEQEIGPARIQHFRKRENWLAARKGICLGASEVSGLIPDKNYGKPGHDNPFLSRFATPSSVYVEKLFDRKRKREESHLLDTGNRLEPTMTEYLKEQIADVMHANDEVMTPTGMTMYWARDREYAFATPDYALCRREDRHYPPKLPTATVETKTAFHYGEADWGKRIPVAYQVQAQWQMFCMGPQCTRAYFVVFLGSRGEFRWYSLPRYDHHIEAILKYTDAFVNDHLIPRVPPKADDESKYTTDALHEMYPKEVEDKVVDLPNDQVAQLFLDYAEYNQQESRAKKEKERIKNTFKSMLQDAAIGKSDYGTVTWKVNASGNRPVSVKPRKDLGNE